MTIRENLEQLAETIEALEARPQTAIPEILDRGLSGNKINGGRITNFASNGITDTASDTVVTISDDGLHVNAIAVKAITRPVTIQGELTVTGAITAAKLHVDEITSDVRNERTSPLEFQGGYGKGLIFTGEGHTRQFTFQGNPDKYFSSENVDLNTGKAYMIEGMNVLEFSKLGDSVLNSKLTTVGTLQNLNTEGNLNVDNFLYWHSDTQRLSIGSDDPNGQLAIRSWDHEFIIDPTEDSKFKIGTYSTSELQIVTDDTPRITIGETGGITLNDKVVIQGKLGIGVKNFTDADLAIAGPIKVQGHKISWDENIPTSGNYLKGDLVYSSNPQPSGYVGWVCIRAGSPGEWKPFGQIAG